MEGGKGMARKLFWLALVGLLVFGYIGLQPGGSVSLAAEKLRFATAVKLYAPYYLPVLAAQGQGYWKQQGLDVEWVAFRGGTPMNKAVAAGEIKIGLTNASSQFAAAARGVPVSLALKIKSRCIRGRRARGAGGAGFLCVRGGPLVLLGAGRQCIQVAERP
jgi:ABC-type nitrate/sulfonate/bicarbonate transport system substrate-binding protein